MSLVRDAYGRQILQGGSLPQLKTSFGEMGSIGLHKAPARAPSIMHVASDLPSAPPISTQVRSTGRPNIPSAYERPGTWPRDKPLGSTPSAVSIISGPERSIHGDICIIVGESQEAKSNADLAKQQPVKQVRRQKVHKVRPSRANHRYAFGLKGQGLGILADIRSLVQSKALGVQERVQARIQEWQAGGNENVQPQRGGRPRPGCALERG